MHLSFNRTCRAGLGVLLVLQAVMLAALLSQSPPHPPIATPLFALGPFLGASLATTVAAFILGDAATGEGRAVSLLAAALALISFGPQKWLDPAFGGIWPAVILGQAAFIAVLVSCIHAHRRGRAGTAELP